MKITFVLARLFPSGGLRVIFRLADGLVERGHKVTLLASRPESLQPVHSCSAPIEVVRNPGWLPSGSLGNLYRFINQLRRLPKSDVLVATYYPTAYVVYLARHLRMHAGGTLYFVQGRESLFCQGLLKPLKARIADSSYRLSLPMVANSAWTADEILKVGGARPSVVSLGIDLEVFGPPVGGPGSRAETGLVMTIGRHQKIKGYSDFVEAMRIVRRTLPGVRLLVVSQEDMILPRDLEGDVVRPASDGELVDYYQRATLYVSSSWHEGFGLPGLEAMACGTPLVTTDSGGVNEYARHMENCMVCPPRQPNALAQAIISLLTNKALRQSFSREGVRTAAAFSWDEVTRKFEAALLGQMN